MFLNSVFFCSKFGDTDGHSLLSNISNFSIDCYCPSCSQDRFICLGLLGCTGDSSSDSRAASCAALALFAAAELSSVFTIGYSRLFGWKLKF